MRLASLLRFYSPSFPNERRPGSSISINLHGDFSRLYTRYIPKAADLLIAETFLFAAGSTSLNSRPAWLNVVGQNHKSHGNGKFLANESAFQKFRRHLCLKVHKDSGENFETQLKVPLG